MEDLKKASTTNPTSASSFSDAPLNKDGVITGDMSEEMMAKTTAIIKKVDKESATRKFTGVMQSFFYIFLYPCFALSSLYGYLWSSCDFGASESSCGHDDELVFFDVSDAQEIQSDETFYS